MIYPGENEVDLSRPDVIQFVQTHNTGEKFLFDKKFDGFHSTDAPNKVQGAESTKVYWTRRWKLSLYRRAPLGRQHVVESVVTTVSWRPVRTIGCLRLLVADGTDPAVEAGVKDEFAKYSGDGKDIDNFVKKLLEAHPEANPYSFAVSQFAELEIRGYSAHQVPPNRPRGLDEQYEIAVEPIADDSGLVVPPDHSNVIRDPNPTGVIERRARDRIKEGCPEVKVKIFEIARNDSPIPELQTPVEIETRRMEILCLVFYTDVPHPRQRAQEFIAYASITNPWDTSADVIRVLEKAAREAAFAATVFAVIFSDITTALILFKGIFAEKVFDAFGAALRCVDAEIWIELKPKGDGTWHDI